MKRKETQLYQPQQLPPWSDKFNYIIINTKVILFLFTSKAPTHDIVTEEKNNSSFRKYQPLFPS